MSRDSSRTYLHLHHPKHATLFEDFTSSLPLTSPTTLAHPSHPAHALYHPSTHLPSSNSTSRAPTIELATLTSTSALAAHPLLPPEEVEVAPEQMPPDPEDDEDVVPDQHAAFGIRAAMGGRREERWRDFGALKGVVAGVGVGGNGIGGGRSGRTGAPR